MPNTISNDDNIIDSREVIERIKHLELLYRHKKDIAAQDDLFAELANLRRLAEQGEEHCADWEYGETLVRDSHFKKYAQDLAVDCEQLRDNAAWPHNCIDWDRAARELQCDYIALDFDGVRYWAR